MKVDEVVSAFLDGRPGRTAPRNGNPPSLESFGDRLVGYGHAPLAERIGKAIGVNTKWYSATTRRHQNLLLAGLGRRGWRPVGGWHVIHRWEQVDAGHPIGDNTGTRTGGSR